MRILHVNTYDIEGGAARAAYRLHQALLAEGIDSQVLVQRKLSGDFTVMGPIGKFQKGLGIIRPAIDTLPLKRYKGRTKTLFSPAWVPFSNIVDRINAIAPNVVHLHWIAGGMMRVEDLSRIKVPIVWSLHDNWAFTGGCHIMWDCNRYRESCGACPRLHSETNNDLSRKVFLRKQKTFRKINNLTVIGLSQWLNGCAADSALMGSRNNVCLPNPISSSDFAPVEQSIARELLGLPQGKKLILFGAMSATSDINKGYNELSGALGRLKHTDAELVVFGANRPEGGSEFQQPAHYLGRLHDDITLRLLYSAVNVMVVPSRQEAFGQTASEAMACATPVVAFGATGLLDIVDHKKNGYLATPFSIDDLAHGIDWVINHADYDQLALGARHKVIQNFDNRVVAPKYIELYRSVIEKEAS